MLLTRIIATSRNILAIVHLVQIRHGRLHAFLDMVLEVFPQLRSIILRQLVTVVSLDRTQWRFTPFDREIPLPTATSHRRTEGWLSWWCGFLFIQAKGSLLCILGLHENSNFKLLK